MRLSRAAGLLVGLVVCAGVVETYVMCPGCIDRTRVNARCEWTGAGTVVADAQLAEELAIRYADGEFERRSGFNGHGGLLDGGGVRSGCMARLVAIAAREHGVTTREVDAARGQRNATFDVAVAALFVPLYVGGALLVSRLISRRFASDAVGVRLAATALASGVAALVAMQLGQLWLGAWEMVRVGNGHLSGFRAATRTHWTRHYVTAIAVGAVLLFWSTALALRYTEESCQRQISVRKWRNGRRASLRS